MLKYIKKIKSNKGESLAEVLISILVISLGLTLMASLISVSKTLVNKGEIAMDNFYAGINVVEEQNKTNLMGPGSIKISLRNAEDQPKEYSMKIKLYQDQTYGTNLMSYKWDNNH